MKAALPHLESARSIARAVTVPTPRATQQSTLNGPWAFYAGDLSLKAQGYYPVSMKSLYANGTIYLPQGAFPGNVDSLLRQATNQENWTRIGHQLALFRDTSQGGFRGAYLRRDGKELEAVVVYSWGGNRPLWTDYVEGEFRMFWSIIKSMRRDIAAYKVNPQLAKTLEEALEAALNSAPEWKGKTTWSPVAVSLLKTILDMYQVTHGPKGTMIDLGMAGIDDDLKKKLTGIDLYEFAGVLQSTAAIATAIGWDAYTKKVYGKVPFSNSLNAEDFEANMKHILAGKTRWAVSSQPRRLAPQTEG